MAAVLSRALGCTVVALTASLASADSLRFRNLHVFDSRVAQGLNELTRGAGRLLGTSLLGGRFGRGIAYRLEGSGSITMLHNFGDAGDGAEPSGPLLESSDGNYAYGVTLVGGAGYGTVYRMDFDGAVGILHAFAGGADGEQPMGNLVLATDGAFYGTTSAGGAAGRGTVWRLTTDGTFAIVHAFDVDEGREPVSGLVQATDGWLYGTTALGGRKDNGTLYRVSTAGEFQTLHHLDTDEGAQPLAPLVQALDGSLYGTASARGEHQVGSVFRLAPHGRFTVLHSFGATPTDAREPAGAVWVTGDGALIGTAQLGGGGSGCNRGCGAIWRLNGDGTMEILHAFDDASPDAYPRGGLTHTAPSRLQGTAAGGPFSAEVGGVIWRLDRAEQ